MTVPSGLNKKVAIGLYMPSGHRYWMCSASTDDSFSFMQLFDSILGVKKSTVAVIIVKMMVSRSFKEFVVKYFLRKRFNSEFT